MEFAVGGFFFVARSAKHRVFSAHVKKLQKQKAFCSWVFVPLLPFTRWAIALGSIVEPFGCVLWLSSSAKILAEPFRRAFPQCSPAELLRWARALLQSPCTELFRLALRLNLALSPPAELFRRALPLSSCAGHVLYRDALAQSFFA